MTGGDRDERSSAIGPLALGVATTAVVGVAMWRSPTPWTLALDAGMSFLGQTVPAFRAWFAGTVPEWSDLLWGGFPVLAEPTTAALYPPHLVAHLATLDAPLRFFDVALALHAGILAAGSATFARALGASTAVTMLAGVLAVLSPFPHGTALACFAQYAAMAWWPWALVAAEALARPTTPLVGRAMILGWVALAAQALAGVPDFAVYGGALAAAWLAFRRAGLGVGGRLGRIALLALGAFALAAPQILATLAYLPATARAGEPEAVELGSLWLRDPIRMLVPGLGAMSGVTCFVGLAGPALALLGLRHRRPGSAILAGAAVLTFPLALGPQLGLYAWLHRLPPFDHFRVPIKLYAVTELAIVWAAALGVDALRRSGAARAAIALGALVVAERVVFIAVDEPHVFRAVYAGAPQPGILGLLADLPPVRVRPQPNPPPLVFDGGPPLGGGFAGSLGALVGMASLHPGGVALLPRAHAEILYAPMTWSGVPAMLGVSHMLVPVSRCPDLATRYRWTVVQETRDFCVVENPAPAPTFEAVDVVTAVPSVERMIRAVRARPFDPVPVVIPKSWVAHLSKGRTSVMAYTPGHATVMVTSPGPAILLARRSLVPGWTARVDDAPWPIFPAAGLYMALPLTAGSHMVELTYHAPGLRPGMVICLLWILGTTLWLAARALLRARTTHAAPASPAAAPR